MAAAGKRAEGGGRRAAARPGQAGRGRAASKMEAPRRAAPPGFAFVEDCLCRCTTPLSRPNWPFLQTLNLGSVINVSGDVLDDELVSFLQGNSVQVVDISCGAGFTSVLHLEEWVKVALEKIFTLTTSLSVDGGESPVKGVLLIGCPQTCLDCLLVACTRRVQDWSLVSILSEFRLLQGPLQMRSPYAEQFIEYFDKAIIDSTNLPEFIAIHQSLLKEEESLLERMRGEPAEAEDELQLLKRLFFSPSNELLSSESQFSEASIVDDKELDD